MTYGARGWILWIALAIMVSDSVISLLPIVREFISKLNVTLRKGEGVIRLPCSPLSSSFPSSPDPDDSLDVDDDGTDSKDPETEDRLVPTKWVLYGLTFSVISGTLLVWAVFGQDGIKPWASIIGFLMGGVLSLLGYVYKLFNFTGVNSTDRLPEHCLASALWERPT